MVSVLGLLAFLALSLNVARESIGIPHEDDWSYINTVFEWADRGRPVLNGWVQMFFLGQGLLGVLVVGVVGKSVLALQVIGLAFALLGLCFTYGVARQLLDPRWSLLVIFLVAASPLWLSLSVTFMTDMVAWALAMGSLSVGIVAVRRESVIFLTASGVLGLVGFSVREYAIVPALVLCVVFAVLPIKRNARAWAFALAVAIVGGAMVAYLWRSQLAGSVPLESPIRARTAHNLAETCMSFALLMAPFVAVSLIRLRFVFSGFRDSVRSLGPAGYTGLTLSSVIVVLSLGQFRGNSVHMFGSSWSSVGDGVRSIPVAGERALQLVAAIVLLGLGAWLGRFLASTVKSAGKRTELLATTNGRIHFALAAVLAATLSTVVFAAIVGAPVYDRYLITAVSVGGILLVSRSIAGQKRPLGWVGKSLVACVVAAALAVSLMLVDARNQIDGLRWHVSEELVSAGIPAHAVDGGDAWFRFHQASAPGVSQVGALENSTPGRTWWQTFFQGSTFCRMVAIESETDLQATFGPALSIQEERTLLGTPFRVMVFPGPDPC